MSACLFEPHSPEHGGGGTDPGERALDQVDPDKDAQPDKARVDPGREQQRQQQHATRDHSDSVIDGHFSSPFCLVIANLGLFYTIEQISAIANLIL